MRELDRIDREIIQLLLDDGRRPYSNIAEHVGLSAPAVTDRIDRLREVGVIEGFSVDLDTGLLRDGVPVLVELAVEPAYLPAASDALSGLERIEHQYTTADASIFVHATVGTDSVTTLLDSVLDFNRVRSIDVHLLSDSSWSPRIGPDAQLAIDCVECGNAVTGEGESERIDGTLYHFCCGSCLGNFTDRYDRFAADV